MDKMPPKSMSRAEVSEWWEAQVEKMRQEGRDVRLRIIPRGPRLLSFNPGVVGTATARGTLRLV